MTRLREKGAIMAGVRAGIGKLACRGGRRGLLAGAAALVGAGLAKLAGPARIEAAHDSGGSPEALHADVTNTTAGFTKLQGPTRALEAETTSNDGIGLTSKATGRGIGLIGFNTGFSTDATPIGVYGVSLNSQAQTLGVLGMVDNAVNPLVAGSSGVKGVATQGVTHGVWGENRSTASGAIGVYGLASATTGAGATTGVYGRTMSSANGAIGVLGEAAGSSGVTVGVGGRSESPAGIGVSARGGRFGLLAQTNSGNNVAVRGQVDTGIGVFGSCEGNSGSGVYGESVTGGNGVLGVSNQGTGVIGRGGQYGVLAEQLPGSGVAMRARAGTGLGVYGSAHDPNGSGVYGENLNGGYGLRSFSTGVGLYAQGGSRAAVFVGDVEIRGNLIRSGGGGADGAVRDGASPSVSGRIGDDGRGRLVNGRGTVTLDSAFVAAADTSDYDVTLTAYGECRGLFVASRAPGGFEVREFGGGTATLEFGYRVSARAKAGTTDRRTDGPTGARGADGPSIAAPEIPPAWRDAGPRPSDIPSEWRNITPVPDLRGNDGEGAGR